MSKQEKNVAKRSLVVDVERSFLQHCLRDAIRDGIKASIDGHLLDRFNTYELKVLGFETPLSRLSAHISSREARQNTPPRSTPARSAYGVLPERSTKEMSTSRTAKKTAAHEDRCQEDRCQEDYSIRSKHIERIHTLH